MTNLHWCYNFYTGVPFFFSLWYYTWSAPRQPETSNFFMFIINSCISRPFINSAQRIALGLHSSHTKRAEQRVPGLSTVLLVQVLCQKVISELPLASSSKRVSVLILSYENEFYLHVNEISFSYERTSTKTGNDLFGHGCNFFGFVTFQGIYMKDLTFIAEGNPDFFERGLINLTKRRQVNGVYYKINI